MICAAILLAACCPSTLPAASTPVVVVVPVTVATTPTPPQITMVITAFPQVLKPSPTRGLYVVVPTVSVATRIPARVLTLEDCLPYNPAKLSIVNDGAQGWLLTDGTSRMLMLDNQADAQKALALAKRHTAHCFIGRDNKRTNRRDYIVEYWKDNSGQMTAIPSEDCIPYNRTNLKIVNEGANGWLLTDGASRMEMLDDQQDAESALAVAKDYNQQCFIGRDNKRSNRSDYIVQYWK